MKVAYLDAVSIVYTLWTDVSLHKKPIAKMGESNHSKTTRDKDERRHRGVLCRHSCTDSNQ